MVRIEVFSAPGCDYCRRAKALLERRGLEYMELDVTADERIRAEFSRRLPRVKALPQIFIDGKHIGGYEDLRLHDEQGRF